MNGSQPGSLREKQEHAALAPAAKEQIKKHVKDLLSDDYHVRAASMTSLEKYGSAAAEVIVDALVKKPEEPHALTSFTDALSEIGKPSLNVILHALNHLVEVKRPADAYLIENFVDLISSLRDRRAVPTLLEQLAKLQAAIKRNHHPQLVHCCELAKVKIHRALVEFGEKGGLNDLIEMLGDGRKRVRDGVVEAVSRIGDRRTLVPLVRLYDIDEHVTYSGAQFIKEAIREIARRERVTPDDRLFKELNAAERAALDRVFPKSKR
ncbi:MAG TPA: HEAT repeat domain-containing protein [Planctomycetota bacterium]|nr:HEAT repeat domain-containing protein [Planctomycetota bacterium]